MRKSTLLLSIALVIAVCFAVVGNKKDDPKNPKSERREVRENRRAERQAAMEQEIDSMVLSKAFIFTPQTAQQEPAGQMHMLTNPEFEVRIWDGAADIFLPYVQGVTPPYKKVIINNTLTNLNNYTSIQTDDGWDVSFDSGLYTSSTYTFKFVINSKFGTTRLTISNPWNNDVTYMGSITRIY